MSQENATNFVWKIIDKLLGVRYNEFRNLSAGIKTVVRGRYRISDVTRYADQYGKPKLSNRERLEVMQLQKALDNANAEIAELQECLLKVSGVTADAVQKIVRQMKKETEIVEMRQSR